MNNKAGTRIHSPCVFAGGISHACQKYLKIGGILLTNNHHQDASEAALDNAYQLIARVISKGNAYKFREQNDFIPPKNPVAKKLYRKRSNNGFIFADKEIYFLFQKVL